MANPNCGGTPAETPGEPVDAFEDAALIDDLWDNLEDELRGYLAIAGGLGEDDHLLIELTDLDPDGNTGCTPYAQFAVSGDDRTIRAEVSGNAYLRPQFRLGPDAVSWFARMGWAGGAEGADVEDRNWQADLPADRCDEIASVVIEALRHHFGIPHPQMLTYQAWGPAAGAAECLELCLTDDVPVDEPSAPASAVGREYRPVLGQLALEPTDRDELLHFVGCLLCEKYEGDPTVDDDGDYVLQHLGQPVWVRVRSDQPAVEIMARVAHDVHSRRATAVEIGLLNRDNLWVRWTLRERVVWQTLLLPASPFVPRHLDAMLDLFLMAMTETRDDLAYRTGAKVA